MNSLKPIPARSLTDALRICYRSRPPQPREKQRDPMTSTAYHRYHEILRDWRAEGRRISWQDFQEAYDLATNDPDESSPEEGPLPGGPPRRHPFFALRRGNGEPGQPSPPGASTAAGGPGRTESPRPGATRHGVALPAHGRFRAGS
jgi:hypothetical protein